MPQQRLTTYECISVNDLGEITLELGPIIRAWTNPYEEALDNLAQEGRISAAERDQVRHTISAAHERLFPDRKEKGE